MDSSEQEQTLPHWDLSNVFRGLDSKEFYEAVNQVKDLIAEFELFLKEQERLVGDSGSFKPIDDLIGGYIDRLNELELLFDTVMVYVYSFISTNSYDTAARRILSELEIIGLDINRFDVKFKGLLKKFASDPEALSSHLAQDGTAANHALFVKESVAKSRYLMSEAEETLASELSLSGPTPGRNSTALSTPRLRQISNEMESFSSFRSQLSATTTTIPMNLFVSRHMMSKLQP